MRLLDEPLSPPLPLDSALIIEEHPDLTSNPMSRIAKLLKEVKTLAAPICDDEACKELIFLTGELRANVKKMRQKAMRRKCREKQLELHVSLEAFVDKLQHKDTLHALRKKKQFRVAKGLLSGVWF